MNNPPYTRFDNSSFLAQNFTTGPGLQSHEVTAIELYIGPFPNPNPTVRIRENSSDDEPGALVATLINPASSTAIALNSFTAPSGTVLDGETTYWITLTEGADVSSIVPFGVLGTNDESGEVGWTIGDSRLQRSEETDSWESSTNVLQMSIRGPIYPVTALGALSLVANLPGTPPVALSSAFASARTSYSATVEEASTGVVLTMTPRHRAAMVRVFARGLEQTVWAVDDSRRSAVELEIGLNKIDVIVQSEDRLAAGRYRLSVLRRGLAPNLVSAVVAPRSGT